MKTATVRELRNDYSKIFRWIGSGEEVQVTRRGTPIAKVVPVEKTAPAKVDWTQSAAVTRHAWGRKLTAPESAAILAESQGFLPAQPAP
jgi:prevent-host-death family protein